MKQFGLSSKERIKRKVDFEYIYENGLTILSKDKRLKAVYAFRKETKISGIRVAVAVSRKAGKAVWRNRIKRLIKEAYRLNKEKLTKINLENVLIDIIFSLYNLNETVAKKIYFKDIEPEVSSLLCRIREKL